MTIVQVIILMIAKPSDFNKKMYLKSLLFFLLQLSLLFIILLTKLLLKICFAQTKI